jgi:hypothetical protein
MARRQGVVDPHVTEARELPAHVEGAVIFTEVHRGDLEVAFGHEVLEFHESGLTPGQDVLRSGPYADEVGTHPRSRSYTLRIA